MHLGIDPGKQHVGLCLYDPSSYRILEWGCLTIDDSTIESFITSFRKCLSEILNDTTTLETVSIERQPPKNSSMCRISHYMHMYIALTYPDTKIRIIPPTRRIKKIRIERPDLGFDTYTQRKKSSIRYVSEWLDSTQSSWKEWFDQQTKKDDCAESFLLCLA
jgi:hypothetical protein